MSLHDQHCVPCEGGVQPLSREEFTVYLEQIPKWDVTEGDKALVREFECKNFDEVIEKITGIARIAKTEGHHPDLNLHDFKKLTVRLSTHAIGGLSINDFVMAVKIQSDCFGEKA